MRLAFVTLAHLDKINIMKIKNKYNIGDYVWIGKDNPTQHKIEALNIYIDKVYGARIYYKLRGTSFDIVGYTEDDCYLTKDECFKGERYGCVKGTAIRLNNALFRILLLVIMMLLSVPLLSVQFIHWIFTGRKEPMTYRFMLYIHEKLFSV